VVAIDEKAVQVVLVLAVDPNNGLLDIQKNTNNRVKVWFGKLFFVAKGSILVICEVHFTHKTSFFPRKPQVIEQRLPSFHEIMWRWEDTASRTIVLLVVGSNYYQLLPTTNNTMVRDAVFSPASTLFPAIKTARTTAAAAAAAAVQ
jgi:hypothetical protein